MRPLFSVGEEVIVESIQVGRFEAVITGMERKLWYCLATETEYMGWAYFLTQDPIDDGRPWIEKVIRKKPKPSTQSFDDLMQSVKRGDVVTV